MLLVSAVAGRAPGAIAGAAVRTADTLFTFPFGPVYIACGQAQNHCDYHKDDGIGQCHGYFLLMGAYASLMFCSARAHRYTRTAANKATKIKPPRNPAPSAPVVISVPI